MCSGRFFAWLSLTVGTVECRRPWTVHDIDTGGFRWVYVHWVLYENTQPKADWSKSEIEGVFLGLPKQPNTSSQYGNICVLVYV